MKKLYPKIMAVLVFLGLEKQVSRFCVCFFLFVCLFVLESLIDVIVLRS